MGLTQEEGECARRCLRYSSSRKHKILNPAKAMNSFQVLTEVCERVLVEIRCADVAREVTIVVPAAASKQVWRGTWLRRGRCAVCNQVWRAHVPLH